MLLLKFALGGWCKIPPMDMKSKAELTPAERLLNRCSRCLIPPMIMQIPCTSAEIQHRLSWHGCNAASDQRALRWCTHRYEEDTAEQSPCERRFDDLFITSGASAVSPQQRRDVERHLRDGAESGVHHRSHRKITLCGEATDTGAKSGWTFPLFTFQINITWLCPCQWNRTAEWWKSWLWQIWPLHWSIYAPCQHIQDTGWLLLVAGGLKWKGLKEKGYKNNVMTF